MSLRTPQKSDRSDIIGSLSRKTIVMRVIFASLLIVLATVNVTLWIYLHRARDTVEDRFDEELISVAATAAKLLALDVDGLGDLRPGDETNYYYQHARRILDMVGDYAGVEKIYIMNQENRSLVSPEEDVLIGSEIDQLRLEKEQLNQLWAGLPVVSSLYDREDGVLCKTAYVALRDESGESVAALAVEGRVGFVQFLRLFSETRRRIIYVGTASLLLAVILGTLSVGGILGVIKRLTFKLVKLGKHHEDIVQSMLSGLISINSDGRITAFNKAAEGIIGLSREQALGKHCQEVLKDYKEVADLLMQSLREGKSYSQYELETSGKDGRPITLNLNLSLLRGARNRTLGATVMFADISQMRQLRIENETANRLAALGEMAAGIAHEIRNPLDSIQVFAEVLGKELEKGSEEKRLTEEIVSEVRGLEKMIREFLSFGRPPRLELRSCNPSEIVSSALFLCQPILNRNQIKVIRQYNENTLQLMADPEQLKQVFLNLIINAVQAMPEGGELKLSLNETEEPSTDLSGDAQTDGGGAIQVEISNSGPPIPPENLDKIFDPFFSTKEEGSGLGLAISHRIVEMHKGRIRVESKKGMETRFIVTLPIGRINKS